MRFYRALLTLYSERFRDEYGDELCRAFADRMRGRSRCVVVAAAIVDVVPSAIAAQWDILRHGAAAGTTVPAFSGDVRFALRQIRRAPLLPGVIIGVIALGISISAGMLTVLNTYAWQPAPAIARDAALVRLRPVAARPKDGGGIPLVRGRAIDASDDHPGSMSVVVNQAAAELLWPGEDPVGTRLLRRAGDDSARTTSLDVIGVAGKAPYESGPATPMVLAPLSTAASGWDATIAVRASGDARLHVIPIRGAIREIEPYAAINGVRTLAEQYALRRREALQANAAAFAVAAAALLLASLGLYATIAFAVVQRTREIGIRLAMGSTPGGIVRHFFREGVIVAAIGLAIGLPVTVAGIRLVKATLLGFTVQGVATVLVVVPVLVAVAGLASWLPARRAGRVDPMIALRSE